MILIMMVRARLWLKMWVAIHDDNHGTRKCLQIGHHNTVCSVIVRDIVVANRHELIPDVEAQFGTLPVRADALHAARFLVNLFQLHAQ